MRENPRFDNEDLIGRLAIGCKAGLPAGPGIVFRAIKEFGVQADIRAQTGVVLAHSDDDVLFRRPWPGWPQAHLEEVP